MLKRQKKSFLTTMLCAPKFGIARSQSLTFSCFPSKVGCLTLFVTHYPNLAEIEKSFPRHVTNSHMAFMTSNDGSSEDSVQDDRNLKDSSPAVTFLYRLVQGVAQRSYGLNVARLAGIPGDILEKATTKSHELEIEVTSKR